MFNNCWVVGDGECLGYAYYGAILMTMTSYTKRCTRTRRVWWCKFGWNPTRTFCVICNLVSLSSIQRQGLSLDFACLFIYSLAISPEMFVCLSIYENAETLSQLSVRCCWVCGRSCWGRQIPGSLATHAWPCRLPSRCLGCRRGRKEEMHQSNVGWSCSWLTKILLKILKKRKPFWRM